MKKAVFIILLMAVFSSCINFCPEPEASFWVKGSRDSGTAIMFVNTSNYATDFIWDFGDGHGGITTRNPEYIYTEQGHFTVTLTAINNKKISTFSQTILVGGHHY